MVNIVVIDINNWNFYKLSLSWIAVFDNNLIVGVIDNDIMHLDSKQIL